MLRNSIEHWEALIRDIIEPRFCKTITADSARIEDVTFYDTKTISVIREVQTDEHLGEATKTFKGIEGIFRSTHQICEVYFKNS